MQRKVEDCVDFLACFLCGLLSLLASFEANERHYSFSISNFCPNFFEVNQRNFKEFISDELCDRLI